MKYIQIKDPKTIILVSDELSYDGGINWQTVKSYHPNASLGNILPMDPTAIFRRKASRQDILRLFYKGLIDLTQPPKRLALVTNRDGRISSIHEAICDTPGGYWYNNVELETVVAQSYYNGDVERNDVRLHWTETKLDLTD